MRNLMFLVGQNGSGKSNFLHALRFVSLALKTSLNHALSQYGTIKEVRRRSGGHPNHFAVRLDFTLPAGGDGHYTFRIGATPNGGFSVQQEECFVRGGVLAGNASGNYFRVRDGEVVDASISPLPASLSDRLFLTAASSHPAFRPVWDALSRIEIYNPSPQAMKAVQKPDPGDTLFEDGRNAASVLQRFTLALQDRVDGYLARIVPGLSGVTTKQIADYEMIEFRQEVKGQGYPWQFPASSMSDGTLRAFASLVAIFQTEALGDRLSSPLLVGLEEPETALHPAAARVLLAALRDGARHCQILATSHSPDLLDNEDIDPDQILSVESQGGVTRIGRIHPAGRDMLRQKLFTAGELLRQNQITPDDNTMDEQTDERQLRMFDLA